MPQKRLAIDTTVFVTSIYCLPMTYHVSFTPPPRSLFSTLTVSSLSFTHCFSPLPPASSTQEKELGYGVPSGAKQSFPPLSTTHQASPPPQPTSTRRCFLHTSGLGAGGWGQSLVFSYNFPSLPSFVHTKSNLPSKSAILTHKSNTNQSRTVLKNA